VLNKKWEKKSGRKKVGEKSGREKFYDKKLEK
jgi:hypothetical protein